MESFFVLWRQLLQELPDYTLLLILVASQCLDLLLQDVWVSSEEISYTLTTKVFKRLEELKTGSRNIIEMCPPCLHVVWYHIHHRSYLLLHNREPFHRAKHRSVFLNSLTQSCFKENGVDAVQVTRQVILFVAAAREPSMKLKVLVFKSW